MNNEKPLSELTRDQLLAMRDELSTAIKKEQHELSRLNDEYRRYGKRMGTEAYNATVVLQTDAKQRMAYLEEKHAKVKEALRTAWSNEPKEKKMGLFKEMTMLDHFAAKAIPSLIDAAYDDLGKAAQDAYAIAAAMIAERNRIMNEKP